MCLHFPSHSSTYAPFDKHINLLVQTAKQQKQTKNIYMKNKITCLLAGAALFGATANAEIVLTDDLSAYGYIDMALTDGDGTNDTDTAVAEFELGFAFTPAESAYSAVAELSFDGAGVTDFETVTISYQFSDSLSFTFGNILSYQGFETYDATGLYQFSYAGAGGAALYSAGYAVGASADGSLGDIDYGVWIGDTDSGTNSFEYLLAYNGVENLTVKFIYADDPGYETVNAWASYDLGDFTIAVESVETEDGTGADVLDVQYVMVYYAMGDAGLTVRFADGDYAGVEYEKFTISPSYAFSDNVFGLVEFSTEELGAVEQDTAAVELIYSF
jgi:hypothetical protein